MSYFDGIKEGDRVWSINYGWGEAFDISEDDFGVEFKRGNFVYYYMNGEKKENKKPSSQTLFWNDKEPKRIEKEKMEYMRNHIEEFTSREQLISLCERAVVPYYKWSNRDSYSAQVSIEDSYKLLQAGAEYDAKLDGAEKVFWVRFKNLTEELLKKADSYCLGIDNIDSYKEAVPNDEMFDSESYVWRALIDKNKEITCYIPTKKSLEEADGEDWY